MLYRAVVMSVSSSSGQPPDVRQATSIIDELPWLDASLVHRAALPSDGGAIDMALREWVKRCDLLVIAGDIGPNHPSAAAFDAVVQRPLPGFGEAIRGRLAARDLTAAGSISAAGLVDTTLVILLDRTPTLNAESLRALRPAIVEVCDWLRRAD